MTAEFATELFRNAILIGFMIAMPALLASLTIGLFISIGQAVTQLQEQTMTFVPKVVGMLVIILYLMPWMLNQMTDYTTSLYRDIPIHIGK